MGDDADPIYTVPRIAERYGRSEATVYRVLRRPEAACFGLIPVPNAGGGAPAVRGGQANSLTALFALHDAAVSSVRAEVGRRGGLQRRTAQEAAAIVTACCSGGL